MNIEVKGRAKGGKAKNAQMTPEERKAQSHLMTTARKQLAALPRAIHGSADHPLTIGEIKIQCYVLNDDTRVLSQRGLQTGIGMSISGGSKAGEQRLVSFFVSLLEKANKNSELSTRIDALIERLRNPIHFRQPVIGTAFGYEATILADVCDVILAARANKYLQKQQLHIAQQCEILVRGFARVGIIALVDEATGFQKDRARDALAKILEAYVAKELQPYVRTFESSYYEHMFRLRGLPYPPDTATSKPQYRPQYFGKLTNDVVYRRLAPGVLQALKDEARKEGKKTHLHRHLTAGYGRLELIKHLAIVTLLMKRARDWQDFMIELNKEAPRYGDTIPLDLEEPDR